MNTSSQAGLASFVDAVPMLIKSTPLVIPTVLAADAITTVPKAA